MVSLMITVRESNIAQVLQRTYVANGAKIKHGWEISKFDVSILNMSSNYVSMGFPRHVAMFDGRRA
jgi:hypothetical protein